MTFVNGVLRQEVGLALVLVFTRHICKETEYELKRGGSMFCSSSEI
jgi:hypothetical protein